MFSQFHDRMGDVFEHTEMYTLIITELAVTRVSVIFYNLANVLGRKIL